MHHPPSTLCPASRHARVFSVHTVQDLPSQGNKAHAKMMSGCSELMAFIMGSFVLTYS